jgi:tripeptidyl-peptidase-1
VNIEFQKAGVRGVSIVTASGDFGVDGAWREYADKPTSTKGLGKENGKDNGPCPHFNAVFPAVSPWVTSVGSTTTLAPVGNTDHITLKHSETGEVAAEFSGGGFSRIFERPRYQQKAVASYFRSTHVRSRLPPRHLYTVPPGGVLIGPGSSTNAIQGWSAKSAVRDTGAAFPDVAALGAAYEIVVDGTVLEVTGTSGSAPTFAGIVSLLNEARQAVGKQPLGFLNLLIYQNANLFHDVIDGHNPGCRTSGFPAAPGWDPVTGVGTPNFARLRKFVLSIP